MGLMSEADVLKTMGVESWRNLSRENVMRFAALMPQMDKEVALKVIEQFPEFRTFALDAINVLEKQYAASLTANKESQEQVHRAFEHVRLILEAELKRDDLSSEDRKYIIEAILETANREFAKDSENKKFVDAQLSKAFLAGGTAVLAAALVFLGGRVLIDNREEQ